MTDRIRTPLFRANGEPDVPTARARSLAIARSLRAALILLDELASALPAGELRSRAVTWVASQRDRFDIPRS